MDEMNAELYKGMQMLHIVTQRSPNRAHVITLRVDQSVRSTHDALSREYACSF